MNTKNSSRNRAYVLVLTVLVVASFLAGSITSKEQFVNAQTADIDAFPAAPAGWSDCTIENISVLPDCIRLKCVNGVGSGGKIIYFQAMSASAADSRLANRYLATLFSAFALNKLPAVLYDDEASKNPPGCDPANCRRIVSVVLPR